MYVKSSISIYGSFTIWPPSGKVRMHLTSILTHKTYSLMIVDVEIPLGKGCEQI